MPRSKSMTDQIDLPLIGWKEWLSFPDLKIPAIKAKIDTGARTSALHTFSLTPYTEKGQKMVQFGIHPLQKRSDIELYCDAPVIDRRRVKDSGGHVEMRYVIETRVLLGGIVFPMEMTLTNRDGMMFRMLLGRTALEKRFVIDPARAYMGGHRPEKVYSKIKPKKGQK